MQDKKQELETSETEEEIRSEEEYEMTQIRKYNEKEDSTECGVRRPI